MTGIEDLNEKAFRDVEAMLKDLGAIPITPHDYTYNTLDPRLNLDVLKLHCRDDDDYYYRLGCINVLYSDLVVTLKNINNSKGGMKEVAMAVAHGIPIISDHEVYLRWWDSIHARSNTISFDVFGSNVNIN